MCGEDSIWGDLEKRGRGKMRELEKMEKERKLRELGKME